MPFARESGHMTYQKQETDRIKFPVLEKFISSSPQIYNKSYLAKRMASPMEVIEFNIILFPKLF